MTDVLVPVIYDKLVEKHGLPNTAAHHGLMFYSHCLMMELEKEKSTAHVVNDHSARHQINPRTMFLATAHIYNVTPAQLIDAWPDIDRIIAKLNMDPVPSLSKYRHWN